MFDAACAVGVQLHLSCSSTHTPATQVQDMVDLEHLEHGLANIRAHTAHEQLFLEGDRLAQVGVGLSQDRVQLQCLLQRRSVALQSQHGQQT